MVAARRGHVKDVSEDVGVVVASGGQVGRLMSVYEAAESGSRLDELLAMRRVIARHVDSEDTLARDLAALTRRQMEISREIEALRLESEGDAIGNAADSPDESFDASSI